MSLRSSPGPPRARGRKPARARRSPAERRAALERLADDELAGRCAAGDDLAWDVLVRRYRRLIYAIPSRAGLEADKVEEVFHATFARLAENIERIEDRRRIRAWMVTTARRLTIDFIRARKGARGVDDPDAVLERIADPAERADEAIVGAERRHLVRQALLRLGDRCRRLLTVLFYDRSDPPRSYESIAAELEMPIGSIGPTRARCLRKLATEYETLGSEGSGEGG